MPLTETENQTGDNHLKQTQVNSFWWNQFDSTKTRHMKSCWYRKLKLSNPSKNLTWHNKFALVPPHSKKLKIPRNFQISNLTFRAARWTPQATLIEVIREQAQKQFPTARFKIDMTIQTFVNILKDALVHHGNRTLSTEFRTTPRFRVFLWIINYSIQSGRTRSCLNIPRLLSRS